MDTVKNQASSVTSCLNATRIIARSETDVSNPDEHSLHWIASPGNLPSARNDECTVRIYLLVFYK
jgi:hypothetical protein